ncbi:MAG: HEAT repeat domain-containing protein [Anaerolineales bacterium]|jgi:HEAT repeat protein
MFAVDVYQQAEVVEETKTIVGLPLPREFQIDRRIDLLLADLSSDTPWADRKMAAQKLGSMRSRATIQGLLDALPSDPFWMVRCAIIQALEKIGDPRAIPTLREITKSDGFQVVRSHAEKAIEGLSKEG